MHVHVYAGKSNTRNMYSRMALSNQRPPACIDCVHVRLLSAGEKEEGVEAFCGLYVEEHDPVYGRVKFMRASEARRDSGDRSSGSQEDDEWFVCGKEGKMFTPRTRFIDRAHHFFRAL